MGAVGSGQLPRAPNPEPRAKVGTERSNCLTLSQQGGWVAAGMIESHCPSAVAFLFWDYTVKGGERSGEREQATVNGKVSGFIYLLSTGGMTTMKRSAPGFTLVEIMIVVAIIALLAAIAIPNVLRGRTTANESAAIGNMRALMSSLEMYRSVNSAYPSNWQTNMYTTPDPDFGPPSFNYTMAGNLVQGYLYTYNPGTGGTTYNITAAPQVLNRTGTRMFFVDDSGVVRHCSSNTGITATSFTIDQPVNATGCP